MKKLIIFIIATVLFCVIIGLMILSCPNINNNITVQVSNISVVPLTEKDIEYADTCGYELSSDTTAKLRESMEDYKIIEIYYELNNGSDKTTMNDVRFYPKFDEKLSERIVSFNSGNGTYYIYAEPGYRRGMSQYIIMEDQDRSEDQIYNELIGQTVELVYFTGDFSHNTGHGYTGIGKHKLTFQLLPTDKLMTVRSHGDGSKSLGADRGGRQGDGSVVLQKELT